MAINERPQDWDNQHTLIMMRSGGGKSLYLRQSGLIPSRGVRAVFWDIDKDHDCHHYSNRSDFLKALIRAHKSGRGFRIGWGGDNERKTYEWFLQCVWEILDGTKLTYIAVEEAADVSEGAGSARGIERTMLNRSRKYGGRFIAVTQRPQEISKTVFSASVRHIVGVQSRKDLKYVSDNTGVAQSAVLALSKYDNTRPDSDQNCCQYVIAEDSEEPTRLNIWPKSGKVTRPSL